MPAGFDFWTHKKIEIHSKNCAINIQKVHVCWCQYVLIWVFVGLWRCAEIWINQTVKLSSVHLTQISNYMHTMNKIKSSKQTDCKVHKKTTQFFPISSCVSIFNFDTRAIRITVCESKVNYNGCRKENRMKTKMTTNSKLIYTHTKYLRNTSKIYLIFAGFCLFDLKDGNTYLSQTSISSVINFFLAIGFFFPRNHLVGAKKQTQRWLLPVVGFEAWKFLFGLQKKNHPKLFNFNFTCLIMKQ